MPGSAVVDLQTTYGVTFIGLIVSTILYGVTISQTWIYYWRYHTRDPMALKVFVAALFMLDTFHTILCTHSIYWYLILNFGNVENLDFSVWSINVQVGINCAIGYSVQLFYARRVYILSERVIVPAIIAFFGGITFALAFVFINASFKVERLSRLSSLKWVPCVAISADATAYILIAISMCWYLYHKRTGFSRTDSMLGTLMAFSISTGLLTSILATSVLIAFLVKPLELYWEMLFWLTGKCNVNSFLAMLNNRNNLREVSPGDAIHLESIRKSKISYKPKSHPTAVSVTVNSMATADFAAGVRAYNNEHGSDKSEGIILSSVQNESSAPESVV